MTPQRLFKYALAVVRNGRVLLCEPHAFEDLIMPGGIRENDESHVNGLVREIGEELGPNASLDSASLRWLGHFEDEAAGRVDTVIEMDVYTGELSGELIASSEIAELVWFGERDDPERLSPIVRNHVIPALRAEGYL